ncbi:MAG: 50S ribosomal protein L11 methyltransferase [Oscillospiraceae bacterium]|nr:50S ribosomal protein L11 methyltransferase [Oscillospiraceae bacterium]
MEAAANARSGCPPQAWTEIIIQVNAGELDRAGEIAHMVVPYGIYIEDYRDLEREALEIARIDLIDEALLAKDRGLGLVHVYLAPQEHPGEALAYLEERYQSAGILCKIETRACRSEDWENSWKAYFHPLPVGERLLIQPSWEPLGDPDGRAVLWLEPGLAFGSGSHATTRLCMCALEQSIDQRAKRFAAPRVLDIGCGSGILSVTALLLGAEQATGVDIDPLAVANARENGLRNGFTAPALSILEGNLADQVTGRFDIVVSNIVADAILRLCPLVRELLEPGGLWISSGIIDTREPDILAGFESAGWVVAEHREEGGWLCFTVKQQLSAL